MNEMLKPLKQSDFDAEGLVLVAQSENYWIYDDNRMDKARIEVVTNKGKSNEKHCLFECPRPKRKLEWKLIEYIIRACTRQTNLIPFILDNKSMMKLAEYLYRHGSKSLSSMYTYALTVRQFSDYAKMSADELIAACLNSEGIPDQKKVHEASLLVDEFLGELEDEGRATYSLLVKSACIKTFYRVNGIQITTPIRYKARTTYRDRAPTPEEIQRMIEMANLREKAMIAMLATGGFRIGTLCKLKYRHVKEDLEAGRVPLHIHVEAELNKGKVCDYDTFINDEAVRYLKLYLEQRREGTDKIPPEPITDESPLFRTKEKEVKPLPPRVAKVALRNVLKRAGLFKKNGKRSEIRVHSLRKFFRTQMTALGVPTEYVEYMMGHKLSTYHDVRMKGVEFLRGKYAEANIRIFPKPGIDEKKAALLAIKKLAETAGLDLSKPLSQLISGRTVLEDQDIDRQMEMYAKAIWEAFRRNLVADSDLKGDTDCRKNL